MAVYDRTFKRYKGPITAPTWRFLVLARYVFKDVFKSRLLVFFYTICFVPVFFMGSWIYLQNNLDLLALADMSGGFLEELKINDRFFYHFIGTQSGLTFLLALFVGPGLISRDLTNNGLPLYLSRPISRAEYVIGKISVLYILLSGITWVPGLLLFGLQASLADGWVGQHLRIPFALILGSSMWILILALFALALSAWVKWRPVAAFAMLLIYAFTPPFAFTINQLFRSRNDWGHLINPSQLIDIVWAGLFGLSSSPDGPPLLAAWLGLGAMAGVLVLLLHLKLRAYEVVS